MGFSPTGSPQLRGTLTSPYMKRSVLKDAFVSDYTRAEFLSFVFIFFILKAKFKNLAFFANTHEPLGKPILAMFYIHCCAFVLFHYPNNTGISLPAIPSNLTATTPILKANSMSFPAPNAV